MLSQGRMIGLCVVGLLIGTAHAACVIGDIQLALGQSAVVSGSTATITCSSGYLPFTTVSSAIISCASNAWETTHLTALQCVSTSCPSSSTADFGFGDCASYSLSSGYNYNYCFIDHVLIGGFVTFPFHLCSQCNACGVLKATVVVNNPTPTPQPVRLTTGTVQAFGGCKCYADTNLNCDTIGLCEIRRANPTSTRECGFGSLGTSSPAIYWDRCPFSTQQICKDVFISTPDTNGRTCRDYGTTACKTGANKKQTDSPGFVANDKFTSYPMSGDGLWDASRVCCACGGGSQKCNYFDVDTTVISPWLWNWMNCDEKIGGEACTITCVTDSSISTSTTCQRTTPTANAKIDVSSLAALSCPVTYNSWGNVGLANQACSGTVAASSVGSWAECADMAKASCYYFMTWERTTNKCNFFLDQDCTDFTTKPNTYSFQWQGTTPTPTIECSQSQFQNRDGSMRNAITVVSTAASDTCLSQTRYSFELTDNNGDVITEAATVAAPAYTVSVDPVVAGDYTYSVLLSATDRPEFASETATCSITVA